MPDHPKGCSRCGATPIMGRGLCAYHYEKTRRYLHAVGEFRSMYVDVSPARDRVRALRAAGVGLPRLCELTGLPQSTLERVCDETRRITTQNVIDAVMQVDLPELRVDPALADGARVSVVPSQRRIRALATIGYTQDHLLERLGIKVGSCALNKVYSGLYPSVTARRHREIAALFDELVWTPGPSRLMARRSIGKGWWGPWAWDDIEDPDCVPDAVPTRMVNRRQAARRAREAWLAETLEDHIAIGRVRPDDDVAVAAILGLKPVSVEQRRMRAARANGANPTTWVPPTDAQTEVAS